MKNLNGDDAAQFLFFRDLKLFSDAQATCQLYGGNLARVSDGTEYNLVLQLLEELSVEVAAFWIGVTARDDQLSTGTERFSYLDQSTGKLEFIQVEVGTSPWAAGEPSDTAGNKDCVA